MRYCFSPTSQEAMRYRPVCSLPGWARQARLLRAQGYSIRAIGKMLGIASSNTVWRMVWDVGGPPSTGTDKRLQSKPRQPYTGEELNDLRHQMPLKDIAALTGMKKTTIIGAVKRYRRSRGLDPTPNWTNILWSREET